MTPQFFWISRDHAPPGRWDLGLLGWTMHHAPRADELASGGPTDRIPRLIDCRATSCSTDWQSLESPEICAAIGVDSPEERAAMMAASLGEAIPTNTAVVEVRARINRMMNAVSALPRLRMAGPVELDLFHRDGRTDGRWLGLHPREFELLWHLSESPHTRVSREELLRKVWRLDHVPETNSVEVHVSRLRAKLAVSKVAWLVETDPDGGYRLGGPPDEGVFPFSGQAMESPPIQESLDTGAPSSDCESEEK